MDIPFFKFETEKNKLLNIVEYANEMYDICKKNNLLRSQQLAEKENTQVLSTRLIELLEQNEMRQVIDKMKAFFLFQRL